MKRKADIALLEQAIERLTSEHLQYHTCVFGHYLNEEHELAEEGKEAKRIFRNMNTYLSSWVIPALEEVLDDLKK